jgi:sec-independent protein translocase protein TatA
MPNIGPMELVIVLVVVLLLFGAKRVPEVGRSLGGGIRGFASALKGEGDEPPVDALASTPSAAGAHAERRS